MHWDSRVGIYENNYNKLKLDCLLQSHLLRIVKIAFKLKNLSLYRQDSNRGDLWIDLNNELNCLVFRSSPWSEYSNILIPNQGPWSEQHTSSLFRSRLEFNFTNCKICRSLLTVPRAENFRCCHLHSQDFALSLVNNQVFTALHFFVRFFPPNNEALSWDTLIRLKIKTSWFWFSWKFNFDLK